MKYAKVITRAKELRVSYVYSCIVIRVVLGKKAKKGRMKNDVIVFLHPLLKQAYTIRGGL